MLNPLPNDGRSSQAHEWNPPFDFEPTIMESKFLAEIQIFHGDLSVRFPRFILKMLSHELAKGLADKVKWTVETIDI